MRLALGFPFRNESDASHQSPVAPALSFLIGYSSVRDLLRPLLRPEHKILHLGCGNSDLSRDLYMDGYHHITNIDFSQASITAQRERNKDCPEMTWLVMDMLELKQHFACEEFDIVLDKCTLDALVVDEGDAWNPKPEVRVQVDQVLTGVSHILKSNGGMYLQLSFGQPIHRLNHYFEKEKYNWFVTVANWGDGIGFGYFFYKMTRTPSTDPRLRQYYESKQREKDENEARLRQFAEERQRALEMESEDEDVNGEKLFAMGDVF